MRTLADLRASHSAPGRLDWIGLRPSRGLPVVTCNRVRIETLGIEGDHYAGRDGGRAVTLLQAEYLPVIASLCGRDRVPPELLRRNLLISGINLSSLKNDPLRVGPVVLRIISQCAPCSRMEDALGPGGYNAMRGHGGWYACVLQPGEVTIGDPVLPA